MHYDSNSDMAQAFDTNQQYPLGIITKPAEDVLRSSYILLVKVGDRWASCHDFGTWYGVRFWATNCRGGRLLMQCGWRQKSGRDTWYPLTDKHRDLQVVDCGELTTVGAVVDGNASLAGEINDWIESGMQGEMFCAGNRSLVFISAA